MILERHVNDIRSTDIRLNRRYLRVESVGIAMKGVEQLFAQCLENAFVDESVAFDEDVQSQRGLTLTFRIDLVAHHAQKQMNDL